MAITSIARDYGIGVNIVRVVTSNTLAEVAAAGYVDEQIPNTTEINNGLWEWVEGDMVLVYASDGNAFFVFDGDDFSTFILYTTAGNGAVTLPVVADDFVVFDGTLGALKDAGYSASDATKTKVVMAGSAVVANRLAKFVDTAGTVDDTAGAATNLGNLLAGASGTAGTLTSFPATAANGSLIVAAINAGGAFNTTISNSVMGQSSVISIPDPGAASASFILSVSSGTQTMTGNLTVAGAIVSTAGNITSGSAGDPGTFISFPPTAANGTLILAAANAGAAFNTTVSNGSMAQSTVYTIGDIGAATGGIPVSTGPVRMKMVADAAAAGGSATQNIVDAFCTAASVVLAFWQTQTNPAVIQRIVPGAGSFDIISDVDAGVGTVNYVIMK